MAYKPRLSVNHMSSVSTPLNCALLGQHTIYRVDENTVIDEGSIELFPQHQSRLQVTQLLLEAGASSNTKSSPVLGWLPLLIAVLSEYPDRCSALIAAGAKISTFDLSLSTIGYVDPAHKRWENVLLSMLSWISTV